VSHCVNRTNAEPRTELSVSIAATREVVLCVTHIDSILASTEDSCNRARAHHIKPLGTHVCLALLADSTGPYCAAPWTVGRQSEGHGDSTLLLAHLLWSLLPSRDRAHRLSSCAGFPPIRWYQVGSEEEESVCCDMSLSLCIACGAMIAM